ncbi:MAG TPA: bifunctional DNA primase/polymerase [Rariglobus sp.]
MTTRDTLTLTEHAYLAAATRDDQAEVARLGALIDAEQATAKERLYGPGALLNAALWYATTLGLPVFPCTPGEKRPAVAHGFKDATTDVEQIRKWWKVCPDYNIGTPTGVLFDVFDADGPEGVIAIGEYMDTGGFPDVLAKALTPRGRHYYVPVTGEGNKAGLLPKVDYRGAGGYVIAPPSITPTGKYWWATPLTPDMTRRAA